MPATASARPTRPSRERTSNRTCNRSAPGGGTGGIGDPHSTQTPASPVPGLVLQNVVGFEGWAPDGQHFVVAMPDHHVFDLEGHDIGTIPSFRLAWASDSQLAGFGDFGNATGPSKVSWYDLQGNKLNTLPSDFDSVRFASGTPLFAGIAPAAAGDSVSTTFQIWDGSKLSDILDGVVLNWSDDGSRLAVLAAPTNGGSGRWPLLTKTARP